MSTVVEVQSPNHCQMVVFDSFVWLCHCFLGKIYEAPHLVISEVLLIGQLIIDRDANIVQWKTVFLLNGVGTTGQSYVRK